MLSAADQKAQAARTGAASAGTLLNGPLPSESGDSSVAWNSRIWTGLLALLALWAWKFWSTWAAWGDVTIDTGHEMYVPWMLAQGKMLYRDVWFIYTPAAPYFNSYLFRLFGPSLNVLYWAGSLSALGSAVFLYLTGIRLSFPLASWAAGSVVLLEAFAPSLFCFPLPYGFPAVYGCLVGCVFLWLIVCAAMETGWGWMLGAGTAAAVALLLKPEYGLACYSAVALLIASQCFARRSWRPLAIGIAGTLPGVAICALVLRWMLSIAGLEFITQENIMSWPTSFFMKTYGKMWLATTGFTVSSASFYDAMFRAALPAGAAMFVASLLWWKRADRWATSLRVTLGLGLLGLLVVSHHYSLESFAGAAVSAVSALFFPQDMVLYVAAALAFVWVHFLRRPGSSHAQAVALLFSFSVLLAFRILMGMKPVEYAIYYNGPAVLSFLVIASALFSGPGVSIRSAFAGRLLVCLGCLAAVFLQVRSEEAFSKGHYVPLVTDRGTIRMTKAKAENYKAAIRFMKEKALLGESVLSIPEDTSLYFFSGTECPTRVYAFTPGGLAPGKMTEESIHQIESKHVRHLIWSNRIYPEYGTPVFGTDFDVPLGDYLRAHYRPVGRLLPVTPVMWDWTAVVWERKPEAGPN